MIFLLLLKDQIHKCLAKIIEQFSNIKIFLMVSKLQEIFFLSHFRHDQPHHLMLEIFELMHTYNKDQLYKL